MSADGRAGWSTESTGNNFAADSFKTALMAKVSNIVLHFIVSFSSKLELPIVNLELRTWKLRTWSYELGIY